MIRVDPVSMGKMLSNNIYLLQFGISITFTFMNNNDCLHHTKIVKNKANLGKADWLHRR